MTIHHRADAIMAKSEGALTHASPLEIARDEGLTVGRRLTALVGWRLATAAGADDTGHNGLLDEIDEAIEILVVRLRSND